MLKIASPQELQAELKSIIAFVHASEKPDRQVVASKLRGLADRLAIEKLAGQDTMAKDVVEFLGQIENAMKRGTLPAKWRIWPEWTMGNSAVQINVTVDESHQWEVTSKGLGVGNDRGTDLRKLKAWFWDVFEIGGDRELNWERER